MASSITPSTPFKIDIENMKEMEPTVLTRSSSEYEKNCGTMSNRSSPASSRSSSPVAVQSEPPKWIILGLWPGARNDQIDYYVQGYESLYPSAKVLLLHCQPMVNGVHESREHALDQLIGEKAPLIQPQDILIHLFGDDAATQVCMLLRAHRARTERPMGVKSLILDSVPVVVAPTAHTLRTTPWQLFAFIYLALLSIWMRFTSVLTFWFGEPLSAKVRQDLYDPTLLCQDARKCYIFPEKDVMFAWDSPRKEGEAAERKDYNFRRRLINQDQKWTGDQERYWLGVENAWEGR